MLFPGIELPKHIFKIVLGPSVSRARQKRRQASQRRSHHGQVAQAGEREAPDHPDGLPQNLGHQEPAHKGHHPRGTGPPAPSEYNEAARLQESNCHDCKAFEG